MKLRYHRKLQMLKSQKRTEKYRKMKKHKSFLSELLATVAGTWEAVRPVPGVKELFPELSTFFQEV